MKRLNDGPRIKEEQYTITTMINIYRKHHGDMINDMALDELRDYALRRLELCRFGENKPTCKICPVHCYQKKYKENMKLIMRYAGPRMLLYHPILAIKHLIRDQQKAPEINKTSTKK